MKNALDYAKIEGREEGREVGRVEGIAIGEARGELKKQIEIAKGMLTDGLPHEMINRYTSLSPSDLVALLKEP